MSISNDPQQLVARYFEHLHLERWSEAARLLDPKFLRYFRDSYPCRPWSASPISIEDYLERDPDLPREVAAYWVRQRSQHPPLSIADYFAGIASEEELTELDDIEFFARHLEAVDHEARYRTHLTALVRQHPNFEEQIRAMMLQGRSAWRFEMVGVVASGDRSYVLFEPPGVREGVVPGYEPTPYVAVVIDREDGLRLAHDPSPYSGLAVFYPPVTVLDSNGETVELHLRPKGSA